MKKKLSSFVLSAVMLFTLFLLWPNELKAEAAMYPPRIFDQMLIPGETSQAIHPAMRDTFYSYSNTDSSVADIEYTDPYSIYIVGKKPGSTVITLYGEFYDTIINVTVGNPKWNQMTYTVREGDTITAVLDNYTSDCVFSAGGVNSGCVEITDHKDGTVSIKVLAGGGSEVYLHAVNKFGFDTAVPVSIVEAEPRIAVSEIRMKYGVLFPLNGGSNPPIIGNVYNIKDIQSHHKMLSIEEVNGVFYANPQYNGDFTLYIETFTGKTLTVPVNVSM